MKTEASTVAREEHEETHHLLVRWTFQRGCDQLTCQVEACHEDGFDVSVVPHWDVQEAVVERKSTPTGALCRHAEIAMLLRDAGWSVTDRAA